MENKKIIMEAYERSKNLTPYEQFKDETTEKLDAHVFNKKSKHGTRTFLDVFNTELDYCKWIIKNIKSKKSELYLFRYYILRKYEIELLTTEPTPDE